MCQCVRGFGIFGDVECHYGQKKKNLASESREKRQDRDEEREINRVHIFQKLVSLA